MGLGILILGLVIFLASHLFVTRRDARAAAVARIGIVAYRGLFALVSIIGLALIVYGYDLYRVHEWLEFWSAPSFVRHVTIGLMLFAMIFFAAAFIPSHIKAVLKYPMLAAVKTWALAHLLSNGDLGSILLFGSFLAWAVMARIAAKRRGEVVPPAPSGFTNDILVVLVGIVIFLAVGYAFHPIVIGVPVFGRA